MENAEEVMHSLEEFSKLKPKDIPRELEDYLGYVAKTGDPVFKWSIIRCLFREKLLNVITDFYESTLTIELPPCPNVDPFNYDRMKANLLEKLDSFSGAPFTVQRISELLTNPWKEYNRADKFMRAIEKNILVVSTREPGRFAESENDSQDTLQDSSFNGIPGPNDSGLESSFSCNDLADPDSSSPSHDSTAKESQSIAGSNNLSSLAVKESVENDSNNACSSEVGLAKSQPLTQDIVIEEKGTETVICSNLPVQSVNEGVEAVLVAEYENAPSASVADGTPTDLTIPAESALPKPVESNASSSSEVDEPKEAVVVVVSETEMVVDNEPVEVEVKRSEVADSMEQQVVVSNSNDSSEEGSAESNSSHTFEESQTAECDTSNSFDSETSTSCDSEVEVKPQCDQVSSEVVNEKVPEEVFPESSEVNEVTSDGNEASSEVEQRKEKPSVVTEVSSDINEASSTCGFLENEKKTDIQQPSEENDAEPISGTSELTTEPNSDTPEMEVGECQISLVDQSQP